MTLTDEQKKQLVSIVVGMLVILLIQVAAVFGIDVVIPRIQQALNPAPVGEVGAAAFVQPGQTFKSVQVQNGLTVVNGPVTLPSTALADASLSSNVPLKDSANTFSAQQTFTNGVNVSGGTVTGTLATAAQPNITSVGTLPTATITDLTSTNVTGTLATANQPNITNLGTQTYLTVTNAISMLGQTFSGPVKYGVANNYQSGAAITHGFTMTPTWCLMSAMELTATVTLAETTFSSNTVTRSQPAYWMCGR